MTFDLVNGINRNSKSEKLNFRLLSPRVMPLIPDKVVHCFLKNKKIHQFMNCQIWFCLQYELIFRCNPKNVFYRLLSCHSTKMIAQIISSLFLKLIFSSTILND